LARVLAFILTGDVLTSFAGEVTNHKEQRKAMAKTGTAKMKDRIGIMAGQSPKHKHPHDGQ